MPSPVIVASYFFTLQVLLLQGSQVAGESLLWAEGGVEALLAGGPESTRGTAADCKVRVGRAVHYKWMGKVPGRGAGQGGSASPHRLVAVFLSA